MEFRYDTGFYKNPTVVNPTKARIRTLRPTMCWIATTTLLVLLLMAETQAAGQSAVRASQHHADLWCTGTPQENGGTDHELWPGHQILGVNFANQTVIGFGIVARIEKMLISIPFRSAAKGLLIVVRRSLERSPWRAPLIAVQVPRRC